ncbi:MAG: CotH kinase family protein [Ignavibacteria bacterium]|nr:CotH kinase family protein [Ignavibacteria bacterium]
MKTFSILFIMFAFHLFTREIKADNPGDSVFAGLQVHNINIQFFIANYWDSLTYYYNNGGEQYIPATVTVNGMIMDSVGIRFKGNSSYNHPNNKKPFKISFDEYRDDQRWNEMKNVNLSNCYLDPSFMREKIHLDFCRDAGIPAPRANYARLYINGALWGFYSLVEQVDKTFLSTRYGDNDGNLFKAVDAFGNSIVSDLKWYGSSQSSYYNRYELKTNESVNDWTDLVTFLDTLNNNVNTLTALPTKINLNNFYRALAADIIFGNLDAYVNSGRNFYIYDLPTSGKFEWIVWDAGLSIGAYPGGSSSVETLSLTYVGNSANRPLISKIYATTGLKNEYLRSLCYLYNGYFSASRLYPKVDSIANKIRPYVTEDPRKQYTTANFETNIISDITLGGQRKPGIKSFISARQTNVQTQLTSLGINCNLTVSPGDVVINEFMAQNNSIPDPAGEFEDWIEIYNNTNNTINISGMYLTDDFSVPSKWQFPSNTTIAARGYLIVWADEDSAQIGLHANFKLSATGEQILFSNINVSLLDSVNYGTQTADLSMSRIPNGTGLFVQGPPTFNANNNLTGTINSGLTLKPSQYLLEQNYPNPFNPETKISYELPVDHYVSIKIYDALGSLISTLVNEKQYAGRYQVSFKGSNLPSGMYFCKMEAGDFVQTRRMVLIK